MAKCKRCGRKGFFLRLTDGLCDNCRSTVKMEEEQAKIQADIAALKGELSDPYILTGYDKKTLKAISDSDVELEIHVDIDGTGLWVKYDTIKLKKGVPLVKNFDETLKGYWIRFEACSQANKITTTLIYD